MGKRIGLMLLVCIGLTARADTFKRFLKNSKVSDGVVFNFAPADGTGLSSSGDLCTEYASEMTGASAVCFRGDGTTVGLAMTSSGSPTTSSFAMCPNGQDCTAHTTQLFDGTVESWNSTAQTTPTDFSACAFYAAVGDNGWVFHQDEGGALRAWQIQTNAGKATQFTVWKSGAANTGLSSPANGVPDHSWVFSCGTYDFVADGSSILRLYVNGSEVAGSPVTTAVGPPQVASTVIGVGSGVFSNLTGRVRYAFFTNKILSAATILAMSRLVLPDTPVGTRNETLTFSRASAKLCTNAAGSYGSWLPNNRPCIRNGGIEIEGAVTNLVIRSSEFDHAAWTKTNVTAPTANTDFGTDGSITAESLTSTVNGGYVESTAAAPVGGAVIGSAWVSTRSGTQAGAIRVRDTTAAADRCTSTFTASTTPQRVSCHSLIVSGNNHTIRIYPGGTGGTGTVVAWGAQLEVTADGDSASEPTSHIATAGTAVTRALETATFTMPTSVTQTSGCVAGTLSLYSTTTGVSPRVLDFDNSNPVYLPTSTSIGADDGAANPGALAVSSVYTNTVRAGFNWIGTSMYMSSGATTGTAGTYDGSLWSPTRILYIGANGGTTAHINAVLSDIRIGTKPGRCR